MKCSELPMTVLLWILGSAHVHMPECGDAANILHIGGWRIGQGDGERERAFHFPSSAAACTSPGIFTAFGVWGSLTASLKL